jgi:hypothetical protein
MSGIDEKCYCREGNRKKKDVSGRGRGFKKNLKAEQVRRVI